MNFSALVLTLFISYTMAGQWDETEGAFFSILHTYGMVNPGSTVVFSDSRVPGDVMVSAVNPPGNDAKAARFIMDSTEAARLVGKLRAEGISRVAHVFINYEQWAWDEFALAFYCSSAVTAGVVGNANNRHYKAASTLSPPTFNQKDPYTILGVTPGTPCDQIKVHYHKQALLHHPDKGGDAEKFKSLQDAYETLCPK